MAEPISETNLVGHPHTTSLAIALISGIKQLNHNKNAYMQSLRPDIRKVARNHILRRNNGLNTTPSYKHVAKMLARETRRAIDAKMYRDPGKEEKEHPWIYLVQAAADVSKHRIHIITVSPHPHMMFRPHATTGEQAGTLYMTFNGTTFSNIPSAQDIESEGKPMALHTPQYDAARLGPSTALTVLKPRDGSNGSSNSIENDPFPPLPNRENNNRRNTNNRRRNTRREVPRPTPPQAEVVSVTSEDVVYGLLTSTAMGSILSLLIRSFQ